MADAASLKLTVLGSGTSVGVPSIGCHCSVCTSTDPHDNRMRPSVLLEFQGHGVVVDTTPDFRTQALRFQMSRLDAILLTHPHADHIMGLDDVRPFNFRQGTVIPVFGSEDSIEAVRRCFPYVFNDAPQESTRPRLSTHILNGDPFELLGNMVTPILLHHGKGHVFGFRIGKLAYLTDHSEIPQESMAKLHGLDVLFLDALRYKPHPTHSTVQQSLAIVDQLQPKRAFFTHICHDLAHERTESMLPAHVRLAYDGLEVMIEDCL